MVGRYDWRIEKARRFLRAAETALGGDDGETAVSRAYYAVYHGVIALLEARTGTRRRRWDHDTVRNDFLQHFARRGYLFTMRDFEFLQRLYEWRLLADYDQEQLPFRRVRELVAGAHALFDHLAEVVSDGQQG